MSPVTQLHHQVAAIALDVASQCGFALAGGNALLAHGVSQRPTADVDLFTDWEDGVAACSGAVEDALTAAGFAAERHDKTGGLADIFPGMGDGLAEWMVTAPGGERVLLQMSYFDRERNPVVIDTIPVLHLEDVAGGKMAALVNRAYPRDFVDVTALLEHYSLDQMLAFAFRVDPALDERDIADVPPRLAQLADREFAEFGLRPADVKRIRDQFAGWPR